MAKILYPQVITEDLDDLKELEKYKSKKEPVWRSSTGASGLLKMTAWRIEVAPVPGLSHVATPQKLSSPSQSLYMDMGMVMMPKKGSRKTARWAGAW